MGNTPEPTLSTGAEVHGFIIEDVSALPSISSTAYQARHQKSGARLLHVHNEDPDNLLALAFRTPPPDDTGLPHILEHTVLCGSKKYPVKDPFVELLKVSLATFLNAMTYPDKTVYPCSSMVENDFYNLASVYCDAVFHPLINKEHFQQEGHHLALAEPDNPDSPLIIRGIVYNEMKGAYSDLDNLIDNEASLAICPDNAYGRDSGGDPKAIPELTYEAFKNFHARYYHPSNSLIFLYGRLPTEKHLQFLNENFLAEFEAISIDTTIDEQPRWKEPLVKTIPYPVGAKEDIKNKTAVVMNWLTNDVTDSPRTLAMNMLDAILLDNAASPLRKALIDSKLGEELTNCGYDSYQRDASFTVGLKGTSPERADSIRELVINTCREIAENGIGRERIDRAFHQLELASRQITSSYPLTLMNRVYRSWLYEADPLLNLRLDEQLELLRKHYKEDERYLEKILLEEIVENPHYCMLTFIPEPGLGEKRAREFANEMAELKASKSKDELTAIGQDALQLEIKQATPNPPAALATLPRLKRSDIPEKPPGLKTSVENVAGQDMIVTDLFSNGITYLRLAADLSGIDDKLIDYLPIFASCMTKMGAGEYDYVRMAEREADCCGGLYIGLDISGRADDPARVRPFLTFGIHGVDRKLDDMLDLLHDRLFSMDLGDTNRLREVILQGRVAWQSRIIPAGNHFASLRAAQTLTRNAALRQRTMGTNQIALFDRLANDFDGNQEELVANLERIKNFFLRRQAFTASVLTETENLPVMKQRLAGWLGEMKETTIPTEERTDSDVISERIGLAFPADVAFVARALPSVPAAHPHTPALCLLGINLSFSYLWEEIRVKRGAYGARASFNTTDGLFNLTSYRDPCIKETLTAFEGIPEYIENCMDLSPEALEQAVIGTIKTIDRPIRPDSAAGVALAWHLHGTGDEFRKQLRQRLLAITEADIRAASAETLAPALRSAPVCVLASHEKLEEANRSLGDKSLDIVDL